MRRYHIDAVLGLLVAAGLGLACSDEDPAGPGPLPDQGGKRDTFSMKFDKGSKADWWVPDGGARDSGDSGATADGTVKPDTGPPCSSPKGVSCSPKCQSGKLCSAAKGGMCATEVVISGPASNKKALLAMAVAYAKCWAKSPKADTLCSTLNTCAMTGTMTVDMVRDFVCKVATSSDFSSASMYDKAKDVCGCSGFPGTNNTSWKIQTITGGGKAKICLSYDNSWLKDYVHVNTCANFPPK